jgi:DNA repair protein RadD
MKLYPEQQVVVDKCIAHINTPKNKPGVCVCPTSFGKSLVISELAKVVGIKVLILQPSIELLKQNYDKLVLLGGEASIYSAGVNSKEIGHLTYATLGSVKNLGEEFREWGVQLVIIDECDRGIPPAKSSVFSKFIKDLQPKSIIGFTATPFYNKPGGFGEPTTLRIMTRVRPKIFHSFIHVTQIQEMVEKGRWTPIRYKAYEFDENALVINSTGSDFTEESIKRYNEAKGINNKIYLEIKGLLSSGYKKILVFCDSVETAKRFTEVVPNSAMVDGKTPKKEREVIVNNFKDGGTNVLFNYGTFSVGYDHPELQVLIMGRATGSFSLHYQLVGRLVRKHIEKSEGLFIDFGGNYKRFGPLDEITIEDHPGNGWSLFNGDKLLSGYVLGSTPITKQDLDKKAESNVKVTSDYKFTFGKFRDKFVHEVPRWYLDFICDETKFSPTTKTLKDVVALCRKYLEDSKLEQLV